MSLDPIFAAIRSHLDPALTFVGPDRGDEESTFPRMAWEPQLAKLVLPRRLGGGAGDDGHIANREWTIVVDVWGANLDATIALANGFLAAAWDVLSKYGFRGADEQWKTGGATAHGCHCLLAFQLSTPVPRTPTATRPITAITPTYSLTEPA